MKSKTITVSVTLIVCVLFSAAAVAKEESDFGVDISFDSNKKHYKIVDVDTKTLSVTPSYQWGLFTFSLDVPYVQQSVNGEITLYRKRLLTKKKVAIGTLTVDKTESGAGDASAMVIAQIWNSEDNANNVSGSYTHKFANGDDTLAIGTGSIDDTLEFSFDHYWDQLTVGLGAGHTNTKDGGSNSLQPNASFSYAYIDTRYSINKYLMLGLLYNDSQSQYSGDPNHDNLTYSITVKPVEDFSVKAYYLKDGTKGQPQYQAGLSFTYSY